MAEALSCNEEHAPESSVEEVVGRARLAEIRSSHQEIKELKERVIFLQKRANFLQEQHERHVHKASLLCDAKEAYKDRIAFSLRKKEDVLLALKSDVVPDCLRWGTGDVFSRYPNDERYLNRDIVLARLELDDFEAAYVNEAYPVPTHFRDDKEVMLAVCAKNSHALALASERLRSDRDVVLAAILQRFHFAPFALRHASAELRGDRKIVRAALNREHGIRCFKFLSPELQKNHRLALSSIICSSEECSRVYEHLSELPEELRNDYDIVMSAVKRRGSNLRFVTNPVLLEKEAIIMAACQQDGGLLQFVPEGSEVRKTMLKRENLTTFLAKGNGGGDILQFASPHDQMDDNLVLLAVKNGLSDIPNLARMYRDNLSLLKRILKLSSKFYLNLPVELMEKRELGLAALSSELLDETTAKEIVSCIPALLEETEPMLCVARHGYYAVFSRCSEEVRDNKALMIAACSVDSLFLQIASARLRVDPDVVKAALTSSNLDTAFIFELPREFFVRNAGMAELAINVCDADDCRRLLRRHLTPVVLQQRNVFLSQIRKGLVNGMLYDSYSLLVEVKRYKDDDQVLLALVACNWRFLRNASICKRSSRAFMKKAIEVDGRAFVSADENLRHDFDMMLLAIGSSRKTLQAFSHTRGGYSLELIEFATKVRKLLDVADTFIVHFLGGIAVDTTPRKAPRKRCLLPRLDCGYETGAHLKREIAEFAGVPMGPHLKLLRSAAANLEFWGY